MKEEEKNMKTDTTTDVKVEVENLPPVIEKKEEKSKKKKKEKEEKVEPKNETKEEE